MSLKIPTIVLITSRSDTGGGPKHVNELSSFLIDNKIDVVICSPTESPYGLSFQKKASLHIKTPHRSFSIKTLYRLILLGRNSEQLIFHSHGRGAGLYTKILSLFGHNCVHTFHGAHPPKSIKETFLLYIEKVLGKNINRFICVSNDEEINAISLGLCTLKNTDVICNYYPTKREFHNKDRIKLRKLGILSRLDPHKNNAVALEYFSKLQKLRPEINLIIAGDGEEADYLKSLSKEIGIDSKISFLGEISNIDSFFEEIDCLISTSLGEGLPYNVLEAFERGVPCLLSDVQGHRFLQRAKYLFSLSSSESFIEGFKYLEQNALENTKDRYSFLKSRFNKEVTLEEVLRLYKRLSSI
jgi:glycosyltransferase involved in cell wall biosynthesis